MSQKKTTRLGIHSIEDVAAAPETPPTQSLGTPEPPQTSTGAPRHCRHLILSVDLRDPSVNITAEPTVSLLLGIFPGTTAVTAVRGHSYLMFSVDQMPSAPWPVTIGGLPFTIMDKSGAGKGAIFPLVIPFRASRGRICNEQSFANYNPISGQDLRKLSRNILAHFEAHLPSIPLSEIMFTSDRFFLLFLADSTDISTARTKLPGYIANCVVKYHHESDLRSSAGQQAKRESKPKPSEKYIDDSVYNVLRPGVMISSNMEDDDSTVSATTTSGVLVQIKDGATYMTEATHRIGASGIVKLPKTNKVVGTVSCDLPYTDVCLVELNDDVTFENKPFDMACDVPSHFTRLANDTDDFTHKTCFLNSPYTAALESVVVASSIKIEVAGPHGHILYNWSYMGQEESGQHACPPDGTCGSVIWNEDGVVMGFYRFFVQEGQIAGLLASVSSSELARAGFELSV